MGGSSLSSSWSINIFYFNLVNREKIGIINVEMKHYNKKKQTSSDAQWCL